ncbi:3-oxo-tetronate kinase [Dactylosporangium sp. AC04546]|uniref:3-oxo-tetronate kinase n=1 Tax=Dactylosporangium sp. AC04546 TaxID=2862460 RepID=UPI001EDD4885|nr:3-oxo-tetronate kinase [Dactylosporangium sp. AC04546]WVK80695.1 3-oxo-tetronate kinase [Dactylosporangium sp. AC04546]
MTVLGCIADDYTGATDVAAALRRIGLRTVLRFGAPGPQETVPPCDAVVVALKTRTIPAADAVAESLAVHDWLAARGARRIYFKYCSTFDSTDEGNIGPVTDALLDAGHGRLALVCPASPEHGRTTYQGHLFVGDTLLSGSPMRHHPLTPMTESNLATLMGRQSPHAVGLLPLDVVRAGVEPVRDRLTALAGRGVRHVIVDATCDSDLDTVAAAGHRRALLTGGAGLARALGAVTGPATPAAERVEHAELPEGPGIVLAGSCSAATLAQVDQARAVFASHQLDPAATPDPDQLLATALGWLGDNLRHGPVLIYSSAPAAQRQAGIAAMGPQTADVLEATLGALARAAVSAGVRRIAVAGGETSGAVVSALGVTSVVIAAEEDHGVPWCHTTDRPTIALLLKSGNFGAPDLLVRAMRGTTP